MTIIPTQIPKPYNYSSFEGGAELPDFLPYFFIPTPTPLPYYIYKER